MDALDEASDELAVVIPAAVDDFADEVLLLECELVVPPDCVPVVTAVAPPPPPAPPSIPPPFAQAPVERTRPRVAKPNPQARDQRNFIGAE